MPKPKQMTMFPEISTPRALLDGVYEELHYKDGALFDATALPNEASNKEWVNKGHWLALAHDVGAEKILFIENDPVIIFCTHDTGNDVDLLNLFRRIWCMARPQLLFLASPGILRVYSLNQQPAKDAETWQKLQPLNVVNKVTDVAERLQSYQREQIEAGWLFHEKRFGGIEQRADRRLIEDLKLVRQVLLKTGLKYEYAHALIGRSIFIRYLEDRKILTPSYFEGVAAQNTEWQALLAGRLEKPIVSTGYSERSYDRVLQSKAFTYAFFKQLAHDFNGDMFPRDQQEEDSVEQSHLSTLRKFLLGDSDPLQPALFLWAYDFDIVPTDLISSIYEEFYHKQNSSDDKGTHYTPSVLVDHVLTQVLNENSLANTPRILDPACGSGIFLVEAFRRIVRYRVQQLGRQLRSEELRRILRDQIAGIEINTDAIRIAAFSLYLALLHYQEPPDIRKNPRLPSLIFRTGQANDIHHFGILFNNNAFNLMDSERVTLGKKLESQSRFRGRADLIKLLSNSEELPITENSFDIIVGNPPWGSSKSSLIEVQYSQVQFLYWCKAFGWSVSDEEPSQAFIARVLTLLKPGGDCGFLVSTGALLKHESERFRTRWLSEATLERVVNFAHVRHVFFKADSPFAFIQFKFEQPDRNHKVQYWSAKRTTLFDRLHVIILSLADLKQVEQAELQKHDYLWKTYWWGSHRDAALINALSLDSTLGEILEEREWGSPHRGFQGPRKNVPKKPNKTSDWLTEFDELPPIHFRRYGSIDRDKLIPVPSEVQHRGRREIYEGWRILVKRTQNDQGDSNGKVVARLEKDTYCFRNSIHGFSVNTATDWERKVLIGILWSSITRYYLFLVSSGWGIYHYEILLDELMSLPIRFPKKLDLQERIIEIVDKLLNLNYSDSHSLFHSEPASEIAFLEKQLDHTIFDLYGLSQSERDLIEDMCTVGFDLLYRKTSRRAIAQVNVFPENLQGIIDDLTVTSSNEVALQDYLYTFLQVWNRELEPDGEFSWHIVRPTNVPIIAVIFATQEKKQPISSEMIGELTDWSVTLRKLDKALQQQISRRIYIDGIVRVVTDTEIYIIKRDERRLWTRSIGREDAEATLLQAMNLEKTIAF